MLPSQFHTSNSRLLFLVKDIISNHEYVLLVSNQTTADNEKLYSKCYKECSNSLNLENLYNNCSIISLLYHLQCHASTRLTPLLFIMIFYPLMMLALKVIYKSFQSVISITFWGHIEIFEVLNSMLMWYISMVLPEQMHVYSLRSWWIADTHSKYYNNI